MNKRDIDCITRFALASSATLIIACCSTGCVYGPPTARQPWDNPDVLGPELDSIPIPPNSNDNQDSENIQDAHNQG